MFSRNHLKWGLLTCLVILAAAALLQAGWAYAVWAEETLYFVETGSAVSVIAICLALIATV
jgi:hypothetical protein